MNNDIDIMTLGLSESWNMFKIMSDRGNIYVKARFGINIMFDINDYLKGRIITKPKTGKSLVRGRTYPLEQFETELEDRERLIKQWLIENYTEEDPLPQPRMS